MYVVTNRKVNTRNGGLDLFGDAPNPVGPNELRLVKVTKQGAHYTTELLTDKLTQAEVRELKRRHALDIGERADWYSNLRVACDLMEQAAREERHLLVYVHGYNNDMKDVLGTAETLEALRHYGWRGRRQCPRLFRGRAGGAQRGAEGRVQ